MRKVIIILFLLALSSPALAVKPGADTEKIVGITVASTPNFYTLKETTALCKAEFPDARVATTEEFIEGIGNGLIVPYDANANRVIMRAEGLVHTGASFIDRYSGSRAINGYASYISSLGFFEAGFSGTNPYNYRIACVYYQ